MPRSLVFGIVCVLMAGGLWGCSSKSEEGNPQPTGKPPNPPNLLPANPNKPRPHLNMGGGSPSGGGATNSQNPP